MAADELSLGSITSNLGTSFVGQRVLYYSRLGSTMDATRQEARHGAAEGTVVIADEQTSGKGRMKRTWLTPAGNIALSVILYPRLASLSYLVMLASLAVARSIEAVTGLKTQIKWPNDVLINGKKVCGILVESDVRGGQVHYAIVGIGLNVNLKPGDFPGIQPTATSLSNESGRRISRLALVRHLLIELERLYLTLPEGKSIYEQWRDRLITIGQPVRVTSGEGIMEGTAEAVDPDGSLLLRHPDGHLTRIVAGDVTLRESRLV